MKDFVYNKFDFKAAKILDDFLPEKMFDAHMHISHLPNGPYECLELCEYYNNMKPLIGNRKLNCNAILWPEIALRDKDERNRSVEFLVSQLKLYEGNVGEVFVFPEDKAEDIEKTLIHPNIRGFKCYHTFAQRENTFDSGIGEYLPETAWEIANKRKMFITLHMVKDKALADPENLKYIKEMSKKYPDAVLILAHAARSFAAWTVFNTVDELSDCENVWFDFSGVCESPSMMYIIKKVGIKRCMWGSDYPIAMFSGKCISIGDSFYWISGKDLKNFNSKTNLHSYHVGTEGLMAFRQASAILELSRSDIEDYFYNNAQRLIK